ncbi:unnamed protein product, partial [Polarella glacialis]
SRSAQRRLDNDMSEGAGGEPLKRAGDTSAQHGPPKRSKGADRLEGPPSEMDYTKWLESRPTASRSKPVQQVSGRRCADMLRDASSPGLSQGKSSVQRLGDGPAALQTLWEALQQVRLPGPGPAEELLPMEPSVPIPADGRFRGGADHYQGTWENMVINEASLDLLLLLFMLLSLLLLLLFLLWLL